jgi:hypothetical protein
MEEGRVISWYVARRVDAAVEAVATSLDRLGEDDQLDIPTDTGRLTLAPVPLAFTPYAGAPRRRLRGRLVPAGLPRPVPVEVEVTGWSHQAAQLGLRPSGRLPRGRRATAYFDTAPVALSALGVRVAERLPVRPLEHDRLERAS